MKRKGPEEEFAAVGTPVFESQAPQRPQTYLEMLAAVAEDEKRKPLGPIPEGSNRFIQAGHLGGIKGGVVRARRLSPARRSEIARMGGKARHGKK